MKKTKTLQKIGAFIIAYPLLFFVELRNVKFSNGQQKLMPEANAQNNHNVQSGDGGYDTNFPVFINSRFILLNY